ncbi:MAG: hypothetical protein FJ098_02475, partial [Deltaproteobacteria bacterium]|nr:hypothetical protein [Deltaproteobacteria bacterium]
MPLQESLYCPECFRRYAAGHAYCPEHGARLVLLPGEPSLAGQVVAERYHIAVELGVGGIGVVYRAEHALIHRDLALKVFRRFLAEDPAAMPRLEAVTDAALRLRGPCTIRVYDAGLTGDGRLFLARELALRPSLRELLDREGPLRPATALRMAVGVARALEEAHAQGLLHRGLSPGNIFPGASGDEV